jgi:hypothetical protein
MFLTILNNLSHYCFALYIGLSKFFLVNRGSRTGAIFPIQVIAALPDIPLGIFIEPASSPQHSSALATKQQAFIRIFVVMLGVILHAHSIPVFRYPLLGLFPDFPSYYSGMVISYIVLI